MLATGDQGTVLRVEILARALKNSKNLQSQGRPLPFSGRRPFYPVLVRSGLEGGEGEGVHVASYMLVLQRPRQGVLYEARPPCLQVCLAANSCGAKAVFVIKTGPDYSGGT